MEARIFGAVGEHEAVGDGTLGAAGAVRWCRRRLLAARTASSSHLYVRPHLSRAGAAMGHTFQQQSRGSVAAAPAACILQGTYAPLNDYLISLEEHVPVAALGIDAASVDVVLQDGAMQLLLARLAHTQCVNRGVLLIGGQLRPFRSEPADRQQPVGLASDNDLMQWLGTYAPLKFISLRKPCSRPVLEDTISKFLNDDNEVAQQRTVLLQALQNAANERSANGGEDGGAAAFADLLPPGATAPAASQPVGGGAVMPAWLSDSILFSQMMSDI